VESQVQQHAFLVGFVMGSVMIVSVCIGHLRNHTFGLGGSALTVGGVLLIALSVWTNATISVDAAGGFKAQFASLERQVESVKQVTEANSQQLHRVDQSVKQVSEVSETVTQELKKVGQAQNVNREQVSQLSVALERGHLVTPSAAERLRNDLRKAPSLDFQRLESLQQLRLQ